MQELDFWLDDISARCNGIILQNPVSFGKIAPRVTTVQVVGKSGDLHIDHDAFDNITGNAACYCLSENVAETMASVLAFLYSGTKGYRRLKVSDDMQHYREARIANAGEISTRLALLNPFTIEFDCKPFRRLITGDDNIYLHSGDVVTNPTGFTAEPLIYFSAIDAGEIHIGEYSVSVTALPGYAVMDCEMWTVYPENSPQTYGYNSCISTNRFPLLEPGDNTVTWSGGVTVQKIVPRWRTL